MSSSRDVSLGALKTLRQNIFRESRQTAGSLVGGRRQKPHLEQVKKRWFTDTARRCSNNMITMLLNTDLVACIYASAIRLGLPSSRLMI